MVSSRVQGSGVGGGSRGGGSRGEGGGRAAATAAAAMAAAHVELSEDEEMEDNPAADASPARGSEAGLVEESSGGGDSGSVASTLLSHAAIAPTPAPALLPPSSPFPVPAAAPVPAPVPATIPARAVAPAPTSLAAPLTAPPPRTPRAANSYVQQTAAAAAAAKFIPRLVDGGSGGSVGDGELAPAEWNVFDVAQFLRVNDCAAYCDSFSRHRVDGAAMLQLTKDQVIDLTGGKVGPSLKIHDLIQQLKVKVNPAQERMKASLKKLL